MKRPRIPKYLKRHRLIVRMDDWGMSKLLELAKGEKVSMSELVRMAIDEMWLRETRVD